MDDNIKAEFQQLLASYDTLLNAYNDLQIRLQAIEIFADTVKQKFPDVFAGHGATEESAFGALGDAPADQVQAAIAATAGTEINMPEFPQGQPDL